MRPRRKERNTRVEPRRLEDAAPRFHNIALEPAAGNPQQAYGEQIWKNVTMMTRNHVVLGACR